MNNFSCVARIVPNCLKTESEQVAKDAVAIKFNKGTARWNVVGDPENQEHLCGYCFDQNEKRKFKFN